MSLSLRQTRIIDLARHEGQVQVEDLSARFKVTLQTIRRDLGALADAGHLTRVHGGAVLPAGAANIGYDTRRVLNAPAKAAMARAVAARVPNGATLFLNIGTTTEAVARALLGHRDLMVVTNNINVANILAANEQADVVVAGGTLRRSDGGLVGDLAAEMVARFKVDFAVIGASALDMDGDLLDFDFREVQVAQTILRQARHRMLVADQSKFQRAAPIRIAGLRDVDCMVTDAPLPEPVARLAQEAGTQVVIAR